MLGRCPCELGAAQPPSFDPRVFTPMPLSGLGATDSARDYTPDVIGGIAAFTVPLLYTRYRKPRWPKATLLTQLAMVGGTYFAVRYGFTQLNKP